MHSKAKRATAAEKARMARLKEMPCVCCGIDGSEQIGPTEVHHLLSGNKRRGHLFTIPLCCVHHRGVVPPWTFSPFRIRTFYGVCLAKFPKRFRELYGSDDELLARTNKLLEGIL